MRKILLVTLVLIAPAISNAQTDRSKSWEFAIAGIYQLGDSADGEGGSLLDVDDAFGLGINIGYNFNNHFSVSADLDFLRPDYLVVLVDENDPTNTIEVDHHLSQFNGRLKATWNILEGPLVPYVEAGFGWTNIDSNVADGPPVTGCWWHPWWGYICSNFYSTFSSTETSYGGALGLRYEFAGGAYLKASYSRWELDIDSPSAEPQLEAFRVEYGWRF